MKTIALKLVIVLAFTCSVLTSLSKEIRLYDKTENIEYDTIPYMVEDSFFEECQ